MHQYELADPVNLPNFGISPFICPAPNVDKSLNSVLLDLQPKEGLLALLWLVPDTNKEFWAKSSKTKMNEVHFELEKGFSTTYHISR